MDSTKNLSPLIVIVGETASGKSALALELAERFDGELICADSWTVRKEVNIGTAKPSAADRERIPHHLLDVAAPCESFTAAVFKDLAVQAINDISSRGKLSIMVGGTGLYVDGVLYDFGFLPEASPEQRQALEALSIDELIDEAEQRNLSMEGIDLRNKRRLMRLLETDGARPTRQRMRQNTLIVGLSLPRDILVQRIADRVDSQLESGLEAEVKQLADRYGWQCEALKGIGYQEWQPYFAGTQDLETTKAKIVSDTLSLAKRQRTWFKRNKSIQWVNNRDDAVKIITDFLHKTSM